MASLLTSGAITDLYGGFTGFQPIVQVHARLTTWQ